MGQLLLLCRDGDFAPMHQAVSAASAALASGDAVRLVLFYAALERVLDGALDQVEAASYREQLESGRVRPVSEALDRARKDGLALFACSASVALLGRDATTIGPFVDEVVGWPTILRWMGDAEHVLSL